MMDIHSKLPNASIIQTDEVRGSGIVLDHGATAVGLDIFMEKRNP